MFYNNILQPFLDSVKQNPDRTAFFIEEQLYTYNEFASIVSKIRNALRGHEIEGIRNIGLVANDDIETYASIFAFWLEGKAYVPLNPKHPIERNQEIINQADLFLVLDSVCPSQFNRDNTICTKTIGSSDKLILDSEVISEEELAYILFTSGSTGKPKGVPITRRNLSAFVDAFWQIGYVIDYNDKFLQPFDLTFDLSVMSYLIPLLRGASVFTVPDNQIKFSYISQLLEEQALTVALMVPSTIRYLKPYFNEIYLPALRYSLFCGEALPSDLVKDWAKCIPNGIIDNVYGPTEDTIFCTNYRYSDENNIKTYNGVLSIGRSMNSGKIIIVNELNQEMPVGQQGELCLSGNQLTPGYWKNPEKNKEVFFIDSTNTRYYKTGDICFVDSDGDILYVGRKDFQAKIQGYRVELGEIEFQSQRFLNGKNTVAIVYSNQAGNNEIALFVETAEIEEKSVLAFLNKSLPSYMIPSRIIMLESFPLNINGKTDRNKLKESIIE